MKANYILLITQLEIYLSKYWLSGNNITISCIIVNFLNESLISFILWYSLTSRLIHIWFVYWFKCLLLLMNKKNFEYIRLCFFGFWDSFIFKNSLLFKTNANYGKVNVWKLTRTKLSKIFRKYQTGWCNCPDLNIKLSK